MINTRVSKKIYEKISEKAKKNRVTVSNLLRNLVEDTLEIHKDVHEAIDKKIKNYLAKSEKDGLLGYQDIVLAKDTECELCGDALKKSQKAYLALFENSDTKIVVCTKCKLTNAVSEKEDTHALLQIIKELVFLALQTQAWDKRTSHQSVMRFLFVSRWNDLDLSLLNLDRC